MQRAVAFLALVFVALALCPAALATNGDNLIAIGPISRAMGGVGIAAPQDAISAVFANPAAMCFIPICPSSEVNFGGTLFMPHVKARISGPDATFEAESKEKVYAIPAIGLSVPITSRPPFWRFGLAAYGVSGLGVDYKGSDIDRPIDAALPGFPLAAGSYTELAIMKFAPSIAFQPFERTSFGLALHVDYATLDLREGSSANFGVGVQVGMIHKLRDDVSIGLNYISAQNIRHEEVAAFDIEPGFDDLELEAPHQVGFGIAYSPFAGKLLIEADVKWLDWADANGYSDFDWDSQWVFAIGAQYKPTSKLALRVGYNYGANPVNEHNGFTGTNFTTVQGKKLPTYYYETFRVIGFPAIVEHHLTAGIGYEFTPRLALNAGYMHAFENTIRESGTDLLGRPVELESSLSEDSIEFGVSWRF